jgi:ABC-type lipoprotein export system ATPase subunit
LKYAETASDIRDLPLSRPAPPPAVIPLRNLFCNGAREIRLGRRAAEADVVIQLITLAPVHVSFFISGTAIEICDTQDEYPTYVNDCLLRQNHMLQDGDRVLVGGLTYLFEDGSLIRHHTNYGSAVHLKKLSFGYRSGKEKRPLLSNFSELIRSGETVVVRGESGCGKSTLLKLIANSDLVEPSLSSFWQDGRVQIRGGGNSGPIVSYVPQDPVFPDGLTVVEVFRLFAGIYRVKNPTAEINYILCALGLSKNGMPNNCVEKLSGGEKRRVHVGIELLRKPTLLLIDEPDSNLDRENRQRALLHLVALNHSGVTIVATSHSPESEAYFERSIDMERKDAGGT